MKKSSYKKKWDKKFIEKRECANPNCKKIFNVRAYYKKQRFCCNKCGRTSTKRPKGLKYKSRYLKMEAIIKRKQTYCIRDHDQCLMYAQDFSFENIDGGCFGVKHYEEKKDCYQRP